MVTVLHVSNNFIKMLLCDLFLFLGLVDEKGFNDYRIDKA